MREALIGVLLLASVAVGCVDQPAPEYRVSGTFTENATQEEMSKLGDEVEARGGSFGQLESFPVQFRASELSETACGEVADFAQDAKYVAEVGACELMEETDGGDEPTSSS